MPNFTPERPELLAPSGYHDIRGAHAKPGQSRSQPVRPWPQISGITLHQTACLIGAPAMRWAGVHAHLGVPRDGSIVHIYDFTDRVNHGHNFNAGDVGIEIDGYYAGVEGDLRTFWRPKEDPGRMPLELTPETILGARRAVEFVVEQVAAHGGAVRWIHAHRQSSAMRQSDPGSAIWKAVGIWAQTELGLSDAGDTFGPGGTIGDGLAIPEAWDPARVGVRY